MHKFLFKTSPTVNTRDTLMNPGEISTEDTKMWTLHAVRHKGDFDGIEGSSVKREQR